jgi:hypothetical protein
MNEPTNVTNDTATTNENTPNGVLGLLVFVVLTIIYFYIKITSKPTQTITVWTFIYFLAVIVGEYAINVSNSNVLCGKPQYVTAIYITIIPWVIIFGLLNLMIAVFPGWLIPFSNTFGYLAAKLSGVDKLFKEILIPKLNGDTINDKLANEALGYIYTDPTLLINKLNETNFDNFWSEMTREGSSNLSPGIQFINPGIGDYREKLFKLIRLKDNVSIFIWYLLTGGLVTSVSYNYIVNAKCRQNANDIEQKHVEYVQKQQQAFEEKNQNGDPRTYTISE